MSLDNSRNKGSTVVVVKKKRFDLNKYKAQKLQLESMASKDEGKTHVEEKKEQVVSSQSHEIKGSEKIKNLDLDFKESSLDPVKEEVLNAETPKPAAVRTERKPVHKKESYTHKSTHEDREIQDHKTHIPNLDEILNKKKQVEAKPVEKKKITGIKLVADVKRASDDGAGEQKRSVSKSKLFEEMRVNTRYISDEEEEKVRSLSSLKRQREKVKRAHQGDSGKAVEKKVKEVIIPETITVQELANRMAVRSTDLVKELMKMGMMITASKPIDADTAELLSSELGYVVKRVSASDVENVLDRAEYSDVEKMQPRSPVISVMGHVDHGKTSLLDALRETNIVDGEFGGITQHIGASRIKAPDGKYLTFLDTPGHEAFTAMRMRGAKATDMVILVVAADDGVKEQTIEAINHAKAANIPIIVAVNKIDKVGADPQRVLHELLSHDILVESLGGEVLHVDVSAKAKKNLDKLLEAINLQSEILELKANYDCSAKGIVIETKVDKNKGVVATLLVQHGKLRVGDIVLAGTTFGRVRSLNDDHGRKLDIASPSVPVEILGLNEVPDSGEPFYVMDNDKQAREIVEYRVKKQKDLDAAQKSKRTLEDIFSDLGDGEKKEINLIIKADVRGSVEAIKTSVERLSSDEVKVKVIHGGAGGINESDLTLARASNASILAFNVRALGAIKESDLDKVDVRYYSIIYDLVDDVKAAIKGMLDPKKKETIVGKAEIRKIFDLSKYGKIAGSYVLDGNIKKSSLVRIVRDSIVIHDGKIKALKRYQDDAKEVLNGMEFGISFESFTDFKAGDVIESYELVILE